MLAVVSLQPALVRVEFLGGLSEDGGHEVLAAHFEAGGYGLTAARLLRALGQPVVFIGLAGGPMVELLCEGLRDERIEERLLDAEAALPTIVRQHSWDGTGRLVSRTFPGVPARASGDELCRLVAGVDALDEVDGIIVCGESPSAGSDFAAREIVRRAKRRAIPVVMQPDGGIIVEGAAGGPGHVVLRRRCYVEALESGGLREEALLERLFDAGGESLVITNGPELVEVITPSGREFAQPATASDRGGESAREALAAGLLLKLADGWDTWAAVCYGVGAGTAQTQKEVHGRLSLAEVDGFYSQVRKV
ncbi:MAG: hypothetical protein CMJ85_05065 [Planctomycetes bacterium]|nr:hypothetical protein [Planctomycetota bacterium]